MESGDTSGTMAASGGPRVGLVAIGRNEGDRLRRCIESVAGRASPIVYVDSGSTDGSTGLARSLGAEVVDLDLSTPFTAARARNAGFSRLLELAPDLEYVQFVDGDCSVAEGWLETAREALEAEPDLAAVCGRRREMNREATPYNRLADMEWNTPVGEAKACGGDALMRVAAVRQVGGYNPEVIAAEDDELCVRLRAAGWRIRRIDAEMTEHDMAMTRFGQWWRRTVRTGHAYAEGFARHGRPPERHFARPLRGALVWGLAVPALALGLAWPTRGLSLGLLAGYPLLYHRVAGHRRRRGDSTADARLYAASCTLGKLPLAVGVLRYAARRIGRRPPQIIEYRRGSAPGGGQQARATS